MFDLLVQLTQSYYKIMLMLVGGVCALIGAVIMLYPVYLYYCARRYQGEVVGVRRDDRQGRSLFWPVVAYTGGDGQRHEALSNAGSSLISAVPGMPMTILVQPGEPDRCARAAFGWIELIGAILLLAGVLMIRSGLRDFPVTWASMLLVIGLFGAIGLKMFRWLRPLLAAAKFSDRRRQIDAFKLRKVEERQHWPLVPPSEIAQRVEAQDNTVSRRLPFALVCGLILMIGGGWWGQHRMIFIATAAVAEGIVISNDSSPTSDGRGFTYHAVVRFVDADGNSRAYRDDIGANPPSFRIGEKVRVHYDPQREGKALIDRGLWNWLLPLLVSVGGILLLLGAVAQYRNVRRRTAYLGSTRGVGA